jgi:hypothetical protein
MGVLHHIYSKKQQKYNCVQHAPENLNTERNNEHSISSPYELIKVPISLVVGDLPVDCENSLNVSPGNVCRICEI